MSETSVPFNPWRLTLSGLEVPIYRTSPYPCSYLPGHTARSQVIPPDFQHTPENYGILLAAGFRRSGNMVYRPVCSNCTDCLPVRVLAAEFQPNRSQRRAWRQHQGLEVRLLPLHFELEHFQLYQRYQASRHHDPSRHAESEAEQVESYCQYLLVSPIESFLAEFRDPDGTLRMISLIDVQPDSLSAVYTFFDPDVAGSSYGVYNVLWQIELCRKLHLPWLYLGYFIQHCQKMSYKQHYQPLEWFDWKAWKRSPIAPAEDGSTR